MQTTRKLELIALLSMVTAILIALYWGIWYLLTGEVPVASPVSDWAPQLNSRISRWWDVLIGPIGSVAFVLMCTSKKTQKDNLSARLLSGLAQGLICGVLGETIFDGLLGTGFSLDFAMTFGLAAGFLVGAATGITLDTMANQRFVGLMFCFAFSLTIGLYFGVIAGLTFGIPLFIMFSIIGNAVARLSIWKDAYSSQ